MMLRSTMMGAALAVTLASAALAQSDMPPPPTGGPIPTTDFLKAAAQSDEFEIQEGQMAQSMASSGQVKTFGARMVKDHSMTTDNLQKAIMKAGMTPPPSPPLRPDQLQMISALRTMSGKDFDKAYVDQQVMAHQQALAVQSTYSKSGDVPAIRAAAAKTAPLVQDHLNMLRDMQASMM